MNYQFKKTVELRKLAEEKEIPNYEEMERKDLIDALKKVEVSDDGGDKIIKETLEAGAKVQYVPTEKPKDTAKEEVKEKVDEEPTIITGFMGSHVSAGSKAAEMKKKLDAQPKVRVLIPLGMGEKFGGTESVILNGYRMNILKGIYVDVPVQVADVLMDSQKQTLKALGGPIRRLAGDGMPMRFDGQAPSALQ